MIVEQLYTSCLSEAAYFICSAGEAAVVDPLRDTDAYLELADKHNAKIKYIFETHFHADFVSGHLELARKTGATIIYGPETKAGFDFYKAKDQEVFSLGALTIQVLHTPGHTLESSCYLLSDPAGKPYCIFTGDTLFVGDVGRPDLFSGNLSKEELAGQLYDSLRKKILPLADDIIVYPAHGPGSACGKALGKETFSTIGAQKAANYALQEQSRETFIASVTEGLNNPPAYFPVNARMNATGYTELEAVKSAALQPLNPDAFAEKARQGVLVLDVRPATIFTQGFIPAAINIGLEGRFAEWAGSLLPFDQELILVAEAGKEDEAVTRLARVGFEKIGGFLQGGFEAWKEAGRPIDMIVDVSPDELAMDLPFDDKLQILDVRKQAEYSLGHVEGAVLMPLSEFNDPLTLAQVEDERNIYVHCAGGYRSVIACSLLKRQGFHNLRNVLGGFAQMKKLQNLPIVEPPAN